ncbi:MAG: VanZ family protein [Planctomycetota bacterium]
MSVATIEPSLRRARVSRFDPLSLQTPHLINKHKILSGLTLIAGLFIVFTGLVPFDPTAADPNLGPRPFLSLRTSPTTDWDFSANVFLYAPFGLLLHLWFKSRLKHAFLPAIGTCLIGVILSLAIEVAQAFIVPRISSLVDGVANVMGLIAGITLSGVASTLVPRVGAEALSEACRQPSETLLKTYCVALLVIATIPFLFSLDPGRLSKKMRTGHWIPFVEMKSGAPDANSDKDSSLESPQAHSDRLRRWSHWAAEAMSFALLAGLIPPAIRERFRLKILGTLVLGCWIIFAMAVGLFLLQVPLITRTIDATELIVRIAFAVPILCFSALTTQKMPHPALSVKPNWPPKRLATTGLFATSAYILWMGLIPFSLHRDGSVNGIIRAEALIPFFSSFQAKLDSTVDDMMGKLLSYALFAGLLAHLYSRNGSRPFRPSAVAVCILGAVISATIEIAQIFLPTRTPSITDVLYAMVGCRLGLWAHDGLQFASHLIERARASMLSQPQERIVDPLAWANALMASLADPRDDAPKERIPQVAPRVDSR